MLSGHCRKKSKEDEPNQTSLPNHYWKEFKPNEEALKLCVIQSKSTITEGNPWRSEKM